MKELNMKDINVIKFKIHGVNSATGLQRSSNNNIFYDTFEAAHAKCLEYMNRSDAPANGFIIMTTCALVKPVWAPVKTYLIRETGRIELMQEAD